MWRILSLFVLCLLCLFSVKAQTLNESETSLVLNEKTADFSLVIENPNRTANSKITLEILDSEDKIRANLSRNLLIKNGKDSYKISLPLRNLLQTNQSDISWFRLRYKINDNHGTISLSQIVKDIFEIRVVAAENIAAGTTYRTRIRTINPFSNRIVEGVNIKAELELEQKDDNDKPLKLTAEGKTNAEGLVNLEFQIPVEANLDDGEIKIFGRKNGIFREANEDLQTLSDDLQFPLMTDKPIYQPEQMLNVRGILLKGAERKTVISNADVEFRIEDEDDTVLYREKTKTSAFGVASMAWKIPENVKLGQYKIRVKTPNQEEYNYVGYQSIKISRYDLPNFAVNAKALKAYYLPNENQAEVEVNADYLFGKPVTKGKVRVVREDERKWNYKEQKYDINEGESHEGESNENGKFTAKFDLSEDHKDLKDNDWRKFEDLSFTAYFTDLTTNRTEQRRFDIRVTKEPIHVYFIGKNNDNHVDLPVNAFVSAFYADGSPCLCDIELQGREDDSKKSFATILKTKTNSLGGGRLNFYRPKFEDLDDDLDIKIIAKDKNGLTGTYADNEERSYYDREIHFEDESNLRISTEKTIFKPGELVKLKLNAVFEEDKEQSSAKVYVDIVKDWSVIESYFVTLKNGKGELKIPYQPKFQGVLKIAAYFEEEKTNSRWDYQTQTYKPEKYIGLVKDSRGIIFPHSENLKLDAKFDKVTYKPAEEAKATFSVIDSIGKVVESVLGVVIFDKAVEERARTEGEFNGTFRNYYGWLGYGDAFGGINVKDLNELDLSKSVSDELQLAAEIMLYDENYYPNIFRSQTTVTEAKSVYADYFKKQFDPVEKKLAEHYKNRNYEHPTDEESLNRILQANGISFEDLRDPWEQRYKAVFEVEKANNVVRIISSGADKKFATDDDFTVSSSNFLYFTPTANVIEKKVRELHSRTNGHIRDEKTLFEELGITELKDRFGRPYRIFFNIENRYFTIRIHSDGKDGKYDSYYYSDDFDVQNIRQDYFADTESKINIILQNAAKTPMSETELKVLLKQNGIDPDELRDGWGGQIYFVKREFSRYENVIKEEIISEYGKEGTTKRKVVTPVTRGFISFALRSKGADGKDGTSDDFTLAEFARIIWEQTKDDEKPKPIIKPASFANSGSIGGTVTDANGAVIANTIITATNTANSQSRNATTDENGKYLIGNLEAGTYNVRASAQAFKDSIIQNVAVSSGGLTKVDFTLEVGSVSEVVTVTAESSAINATDSAIVTVDGFSGKIPKALSLVELKPGVAKGEDDETSSQKSTPKLREYFPETLVWQPELITDKDGKAELKFKMADNITTWKLYTIASTKNGKFGVAEKEVTAFQPFFVDLDPPKFLTEGDEIYLPTQVRNYTPSKQKVDVTMSKSAWFSFLTPELQKIEVEKNAASNAVFGFKANLPIKDGKQRVTAIAAKESDAIEKPVTVRPNGEEIVQTDARLFTNLAQFEVNFPQNVLPKTQKAELKIYPNLLAHVTESVEGLLQRPYGCGEQTVSSTYPNLMILKFIKIENSLAKKAKKNLQKGYERLLGYQIADGGFSYWGGKDESNIALTAYALRFLNDAKQFIDVDEKVIENAANYLVKQQRADGSFYKKYYWEEKEDLNRTKTLTTYVARVLSILRSNIESLDKALVYLKNRNAEIDEPYSLALYALANFDSGRTAEGERIVLRLQNLAKSEGNSAYWNLETNTPFYGWGRAGRIETSALVIQALLKSKEQNTKNKDLISKGAMFLLNNKDRYGVWYSTQTTINVLDTFLASLGEVKSHNISVSMNGEKLKDFAVSADQIEPIVIFLNDKLTNTNHLEVKSSDDSQVMTQIVKTHYIDWRDSVSTNRNVNDSRAIRLDYKCDKLNAKIMETVNCSVVAERIGFQGYGMLLAEIGIPPGADVSRESLEKAFKNDWSLSRYDVLPDRIIIYMWAKAGGSKFDFSFKPRYSINAQTPMSIVYDYYNEESRGVVSPLKFAVK